jgi:hypothetical protein
LLLCTDTISLASLVLTVRRSSGDQREAGTQLLAAQGKVGSQQITVDALV